MDSRSIPKCGICCTQNPKRSIKHCASFLAVESTRCTNLSFTLERHPGMPQTLKTVLMWESLNFMGYLLSSGTHRFTKTSKVFVLAFISVAGPRMWYFLFTVLAGRGKQFQRLPFAIPLCDSSNLTGQETSVEGLSITRYVHSKYQLRDHWSNQ